MRGKERNEKDDKRKTKLEKGCAGRELGWGCDEEVGESEN